jgi:hypothetical protein
MAGVGKTTLAATLPGKKLLLNFDPGGENSIAYRDDVELLDYSGVGSEQGDQFRYDDPFKLSTLLEGYDSLIVDSLTTIGDLALNYGITKHNEKGWDGGSIVKPHRDAYGARLNLTLRFATNVLRICQSKGIHVCFCAHEAQPDKDKDGIVQAISLLLGGQLPNQLGLRFSEIWAMYDRPGNKKTIGVRPCRLRTPMKSRMFDVSKVSEFDWDFDPNTGEGETIAEWHQAWLDGGKRKLSPPT